MTGKKNVTIIGLEDFRKQLERLGKCAREEALRDAAEAGARVVEAQAKINIESKFSKHSRGGLAGSIIVEVKEKATSAEAKIGPSSVYGRIQELGGTIKPVRAKLLSWIDPETGKRHVAKRVMLPARPYLRPALDEHKGEVEEAVKVTIRRKIAEVLID